MNKTIETILQHRSIRSFTDQRLTEEEIRVLVESAQSASTSSYIQAYSIIGVTDQSKKRELAALAGNQPYVEKNGHLFVFCADLYRHDKIAGNKGEDVKASLEGTETFMVSVIDSGPCPEHGDCGGIDGAWHLLYRRDSKRSGESCGDIENA